VPSNRAGHNGLRRRADPPSCPNTIRRGDTLRRPITRGMRKEGEAMPRPYECAHAVIDNTIFPIFSSVVHLRTLFSLTFPDWLRLRKLASFAENCAEWLYCSSFALPSIELTASFTRWDSFVRHLF
jgi:hypothetical protein